MHLFTMTRYIVCLLLIFTTQVTWANYQRVVSINLCTDHLLYLLEDAENIASVSFLSQDAGYSYLHEEMAQFPVNAANIEEIIPLKPDLVLAGSYTDIHTIHILQHLGYNVEQIDIPWDMPAIEDTIIQAGKILKREDRAIKIIENMRSEKSRILTGIKSDKKPTAIILAPNGFTHGKGSMKGDLLELARYENLAAKSGIQGSGNISLETLLYEQPDFLIIEDSTEQKNSMAQRFLEHPALSRGLLKTQVINLNPNLWSCGGPSMIDALAILAEAHP